MLFEVELTGLSKVPVYQEIAEQAAHMHLLGMNPNRIAVHLGVERTTISRALRWIRSHYLGM
jgi:DNA invertase Pin-like site-specific DNA recombinase